MTSLLRGVSRASCFLSIVCCSLLLALPARDSQAAAPPAAPGLQEVRHLPQGVSIRSEKSGLYVDLDWVQQWPPSQSEITFYAIIPPSVDYHLKLSDYTLRFSPADSLAESGPQRISKAEGDENTALTKAIRFSEMVQVEDQGIVRFHRLVRIRIKPHAVKDPSQSGKGYFEKLSFALVFDKPFKAETDSEALRLEAPWGFRRIFEHLVANPQAASAYAERNRSQVHSEKLTTATWTPMDVAGGEDRWFRILVGEEGLLRITSQTLAQVGVNPAEIHPRSVAVYSEGKPVPTRSAQGPEPSFAQGNSMIFYALASESRFTRERAYWVRLSKDQRIVHDMAWRKTPAESERSQEIVMSLPKKLRIEKDEELLIEHDNFLSIVGSHWAWKRLHSTQPVEITFNLPHPDPGSSEPVEFRFVFHFDRAKNKRRPLGARPPKMKLRINNRFEQTLDPLTSDSDTTRSLLVPIDALQVRNNVIRIEFESPPSDYPSGTPVFLDYFTVDYRRGLIAYEGKVDMETGQTSGTHLLANFPGRPPRVFDITEPETPFTRQIHTLPDGLYGFYNERAGRHLLAIDPDSITPVTTATLWLRPDLADKNHAADYLIIYHRLLEDEIPALVRHQQSRGFVVKAVEIDSIYQQYSSGQFSPLAIKRFLFDTVRNWRIPPTYVCLVGDASSDYRGNLRTGIKNLVPAYTYAAHSNEFWASETWYTMLLGEDQMPDVLIGRISARTTEDAHEMIRKTISYQNNPPGGPWRARFGYCSDDRDGFRKVSEPFRTDYRPTAIADQKIYIEDFPFEDNFYLPKSYVKAKNLKVSTATTLKLLESYNRGVSAMFFFGHGSPNIWADERVWFGGESQNSDNLNLRNAGRLPFLATFTCNHGAFDYPMPKWHICISEDMMRVRKGGAIALWVPSGPGKTHIHERIAQSLMQTMMREKLMRLGEIDALTKIDYTLKTGKRNLEAREMALMYVLLGDPALDLAIPTNWEEATIQPQFVPYRANPTVWSRKRTVTIKGSSGSVSKGRFVASVYAPDGSEVYQSKPLLFKAGAIKWKYKLPIDATWGEWTVRIYYGDGTSAESIPTQDGLLHATFQVTRPMIEVVDFREVETEEQDARFASLELVVRNLSEQRVSRAPLRVMRHDAKGSRKVWTKKVRLEGNEKKTFPLKVRRSDGPLTALTAYVDKYNQALDPVVEIQTSQELILKHISETSPSIALNAHGIDYIWKSYDPKENLTLKIPVYYRTASALTDVWIYLDESDGTRIAQSKLQLKKSDQGTGVIHVSLNPNRSEPDLDKEYVLFVTQGLKSNERLAEITLNIPPPRLPDLSIVPGSIHFDPPNPSEGHTIFAHAMVENTGAAPAGEFVAELWSVDSNGSKRKLKSSSETFREKWPGLAPGRRCPIKLRWDPDAWEEIAGSLTVRIEVDSLKRVPELDESNNSLDEPLQVLSRPHVEVLKEQTRVQWQDIGAEKEVELFVRIRNTGQATAVNRRLGFFRKIPKKPSDYRDPEFLVNEIELPPIAGGEEMEFSHKWITDPDDAKSTATAYVYQSLKSIRAGLTAQAIAQPEW